MRSFTLKQNQAPKHAPSMVERLSHSTPGLDHRVSPLVHPEHSLGHHAVQRLSEAPPEKTDASLISTASPRIGHVFARIPVHSPAATVLQTKLAINTPGDEYEQEADRVSEQVMRMSEAQLQRTCACGGRCEDCQKEKPRQEPDVLRTKRVGGCDLGQDEAPPIVHEALRSPGQPLDAATRAYMEPRFGFDFSRIRIHADAKAAESARAIGALAYTVGNDIAFTWFDPSSMPGRKLLAHELTHVAQQGAATAPGRPGLQRSPSPGGPGGTTDTSSSPSSQGRFGSDPTFRMVASMLWNSYQHGRAGAHVVLEYDGTRTSLSSYAAGSPKPTPQSAEPPLSQETIASTLEEAFELVASFGHGTLELDYVFENGRLVEQKFQASHPSPPPAPTAPRKASTREPQTLDDCDPSDTNYASCLHKLEQGNTRRALDAAHDVAEALLDPTMVVPGGEEGRLAIKGAADLYKMYRMGRRAVNAARAAGQDVRAIEAASREIESLGAMDDASKTLLENNPELRRALIENPLAADALKLCKSPCLPDFATPGQVKRLNEILARARDAGMEVDQGRLKLFLHRQPDVASLSEAIDALADSEASVKELRAEAEVESLLDVAEALEQQGVREAKPADVRLQEAKRGQEYDRELEVHYPARQVPIRDQGGKLRRLDSYDPVAGEIISRKSLITSNGQIALADEFTMIDYFQEFALKYPDGATIADVPSSRGMVINGRPLAGQTLRGRYILEVPPQNYAIPDRILEEARQRNITIRDERGKTY